jgi:hypothetical protein
MPSVPCTIHKCFSLTPEASNGVDGPTALFQTFYFLAPLFHTSAAFFFWGYNPEMVCYIWGQGTLHTSLVSEYSMAVQCTVALIVLLQCLKDLGALEREGLGCH